jgi:hypothetical protein
MSIPLVPFFFGSFGRRQTDSERGLLENVFPLFERGCTRFDFPSCMPLGVGVP